MPATVVDYPGWEIVSIVIRLSFEQTHMSMRTTLVVDMVLLESLFLDSSFCELHLLVPYFKGRGGEGEREREGRGGGGRYKI